MSDVEGSELVSCPECGAALVDGLDCWEQLGMILSWEWQDPELQAEHFLTVASYNLQHSAQFMDDVIAGLGEALIERLDNRVAVEELRRRAARVYEGKKRVLRPEGGRRPALRRWRVTVADVYIPNQPEGAAGRVRKWAASIRSEL